MKVVLEAPSFNLDLSLNPSFVSSLYAHTPKGWVKIVGFFKGLRLKQIHGLIEAEVKAESPREQLESEILLETGLWHGPFESLLAKLPRRLRTVAEALADAYPGVRLPVAKHDFTEILIAVTLSKRTSYRRFVLPWCRKIWERYGHELRRIAALPTEEVKRIGTSYQLFDMLKTLKSYFEATRTIRKLPAELRQAITPTRDPEELFRNASPEVARALLLNLCWGVGPKVADSIVLSTFQAPDVIPCDVHLAVIVRRLGIASELSLPRKSLCRNFSCLPSPYLRTCPVANECIRAVLARGLGELGGWLQTVLYLHGTEYCLTAKPRCERCPLRGLCES